jgi:citrate lyase subunit beta/citryl-CoA lyase
VWDIAGLAGIECLSFGVMDFVSAHFGAVPGDAMRSPGQFSHPLVTRAKVEISAACHAHGKVASHNVCTNIHDPLAVASDPIKAAESRPSQRKSTLHDRASYRYDEAVLQRAKRSGSQCRKRRVP